MSGAVVALVVVPLFVVLAAVLVVGSARRRDTDAALGHLSRTTRRRDQPTAALADQQGAATGREVERSAALERRAPAKDLVSASPGPPVAWSPPDDEAVGVSRRQFLNRSMVNVMGFSLTAFGLACIGFLWPQATTGFGAKIRVGSVDDVKQQVRDNDGFLYVPEGRMWVTEYPTNALDKARNAYSPSELTGMEAGLIALYQKCPHLGCRVPECKTSQWFECPCHGSQYNRVGEKKGGPAPRGMDRFTMSIDGGAFTVDTSIIIPGPPIGVNTTGQESEGPHCIGGGAEH